MFNKGDYVRHRMAPNTRLGTIEGSRIERGYQEYLFRQDKRFTFDHDTPDFYVLESEIEACQRPTDAEVEAINRLTERGS
jgi:hypothetical protein